MPNADEIFMREALAIAARGIGAVSPNPPVGCVLVKNGVVIGRGYHRRCGDAHAEVNALRDAARLGNDPTGATAYVTLMPCHHHGKTPPCTGALIAAKIARAVVALDDPNPTSGDGAAALRARGITVEIGGGATAARRLMAGFLHCVATGLPRVTLKYAMTLDGKIALSDGASQWISNDVSRDYAHVLRAQADAILIGGGTARRDAPRLNVRLPNRAPDAPQPKRVIISATLNVPPLAAFGDGEWLIFHTAAADGGNRRSLQERGVTLRQVAATANARVDLRAALRVLAAEFGVREVLCEGGAHLHAALLQDKLAQAAAVFIAPLWVGGTGISAMEGEKFFPLGIAPRLINATTENFAGDIYWRGEIAYCES
ncbi:riboflavin biosynthesis protein RibD [Planctomycetales bacterium]|nr:riboflavin biosynthesis protein RibD [Planctomycetales bacterium]